MLGPWRVAAPESGTGATRGISGRRDPASGVAGGFRRASLAEGGSGDKRSRSKRSQSRSVAFRRQRLIDGDDSEPPGSRQELSTRMTTFDDRERAYEAKFAL